MASQEQPVSQAELWDELYPILHEGCQYSPLHRSLARLIREELAKLRFSTVLDVGCGNGSKLAMLHLPPDCEVVGIDISEAALSLARSAVGMANFQVLDVEKEPILGRFDVVICSEVLEHLSSDVDALNNIRGACGGTFIITVPAKPLDPIGRQVGHVRHYTKGELRDRPVTTSHSLAPLSVLQAQCLSLRTGNHRGSPSGESVSTELGDSHG